MTVLVARHGLSEANNAESLAFGKPEASLMETGIEQGRALGDTLRGSFSIDTNTAPVAVSELRRSQETAEAARFRNVTIDPLLNEVITSLPKPTLKEMIANKALPAEAIDVAEAILEDPPSEQIWITHGLVIAGLC